MKEENNTIKGANKDASADLKSEGVGNVEAMFNNNIITLKNVIFAEGLSNDANFDSKNKNLNKKVHCVLTDQKYH